MAQIRKKQIGVVLSHKMAKTAIVEVTRNVQHPLFGKYYKKRKKYKVHDEENTCQPGDKVLIVESRPLSRTKRWVALSVIEKAEPVLE